MRLRLARWLSLIAAAAVPALVVQPGPAAAAAERAPLRPAPPASADDATGAHVIVKYKALGSLMRALSARGSAVQGPQFAATLGQRHGLTLTDGRAIASRSQVVHGDRSLSSVALAERLAADPEVEYAVPDYRRHALALPNDLLYTASASISPAAGQWYLHAPDATFVAAINAVGAWNITKGSAGIVVADVDTGVLFSHPDLNNKLYPGYDFVTDPTAAGDGNGRDNDATDPGDWTTAGECGLGQPAESSSWHGTQTAGLIGAHTNNGIGMASVGYNTMVLPLRALGKCGGKDSDIAAAMLWAAGIAVPGLPSNPHPAKVINLSLGGPGTCSSSNPGNVYPDTISQLTAAGVVVVAAAGNDEGLAVTVPANCAGVIAVAGVRHVGTKVGYSDIGPEVAISAPAGNCVNSDTPVNSGTYPASLPCLYPILTAANNGAQGPATHTYTTGINTAGTDLSIGTSFSTPLVAGTAALMLSVNPSLTPAQVKALLQGTARPFPTTSTDPTVAQCHAPNGAVQDECICTTSTCGAGLLDAAAAVSAAAATALPVASVNASANPVVAGDSVTFDGSASVAPGNLTITSYQWTIASGAAIAAFSGPTDGTTAQVTTSGVGSFTVQLTVTDSAGQHASSTATVTVNAQAAPTVSVLASASVVAAGASVSFDGSGSAAASGLAITGYQWTITSGASIASFTTPTDASTAAVLTAGAGSGSFTVTLTVTDSLGRQGSGSSTVSVTAVLPTASIAASATAVAPGSSVSFDGSGSTAPAPRTIGSYQWTITSGASIAAFSVGSSTTSPITSVTTSGAGSFTVQLTVTDSVGAQDSRSATVTVSAPASPGGGGGGAASVLWVLGVLLAALALRGPAARRGLSAAPTRPRRA